MGMPPLSTATRGMWRRAVSVLAVGVLVGLAGCGAGSTETSSGDEPEKPSDSAPAVLNEDNFADKVVAAQVAAGSTHVEATIDASGQSFELSGDVAGLGSTDTEMDVTATFGDEKLHLLVVERVLYVKGAEFAPKGKKWLKVDLSDPSNPLGRIFDSVNPGNFTAYLTGVTAFEDQGVETVDGVETRHYSVTVDTAKMLESNPMFQGQDASTLGLPDELTTQAYLDSDNRPVRLMVDLEATGSFDVHFSDYGRDVTVTAPDPRTVGEFSL